MLTAANEASLKGIINQSTLDTETKRILTMFVKALAAMSPAAADGTVGLASDTLVGTAETITIKNGLITAIANN